MKEFINVFLSIILIFNTLRFGNFSSKLNQYNNYVSKPTSHSEINFYNYSYCVEYCK